jgi:threonine/homoserine/homoserine lactone efflux protein
MKTLRLLKIVGFVVAAVVALLILSVLASVLLSLLGALIGVAIIAGLVYLAYKLYTMSSGEKEEFEVESKVKDLQREFER